MHIFCVCSLLICSASAAFGSLQSMIDAAIDQQLKRCADDNTPICARRSNSKEYLMFKNECHLQKTKHENMLGPLVAVAMHYCVPSCEFTCDDDRAPVCGVSMDSGELRTFRNRCEMTRSTCQSKTEWLLYRSSVCPRMEQETRQHTVHVAQPMMKTQSKSKSAQSLSCTNVFRPVCASYAGVKSSFTNECLLNAENLKTGRNWLLVSEGLCGEDSFAMKQTLKTTQHSNEHTNRPKRSHQQLNHLDDMEDNKDVVQIYAPSTFQTEFISGTGKLERTYSLPAREPYIAPRPSMKMSNHCEFSNDPICGTFKGKTRSFANVCEMMEHSQQVGNDWTVLHEGICRNCDAPCPSDYNPICVSRNGIEMTINNNCYFQRMRCKDTQSYWEMAHVGKCALDAEEDLRRTKIDSVVEQNSVKKLKQLPEAVLSDDWLISKTMKNIKEMFVKKPDNKNVHRVKKLATKTIAESHTMATTLSAAAPAMLGTTIESETSKTARELQTIAALIETHIELTSSTQRTARTDDKTAAFVTRATKQPTTSTTVSASSTIDVDTTEKQQATTAESNATEQTTPNLDYVEDDTLLESSQQTSIYGLDKNSLIMRLLRARSGDEDVLL